MVSFSQTNRQIQVTTAHQVMHDIRKIERGLLLSALASVRLSSSV
jgi:hypothetical protein